MSLPPLWYNVCFILLWEATVHTTYDRNLDMFAPKRKTRVSVIVIVEPFLSHWIRTTGQWSRKIGEDTSESSTFYPIIIIKIISFVKYVITRRYFLQKRIWTFYCTWRKFTSLFPLWPFLFPSSSCVCMLVYLSL